MIGKGICINKGGIMELLKCKRCGYEWLPRTPDPKVCPYCKSREWKRDGVKIDMDDVKRNNSGENNKLSEYKKLTKG